MEAKLILIDANSKGAEFLVKKRERDGAYTMIPRGRDRGFGSAHTDSVDLYIGKRFVNFSGDAWRFFEGTLDTEKFWGFGVFGGQSLIYALVGQLSISVNKVDRSVPRFTSRTTWRVTYSGSA